MSHDRKKKLYSVVVVVVFSFLTAHPTSAGANPQKALDAPPIGLVTENYASINDAFMKHDIDRIMSYFTSDFTEVTSTGATVNRDQERKEYQSQLSKIKSMTCRFDIQDFTPCTAGAYCDLKIHTDGIGFKRVMFMKIQGNFTNDLVVHDLWVNTPIGWRLKSRLTLLDQTKVYAD
jgi:hypothetical protein